MSKDRMDKLTTIADRKLWALKVMYRHTELVNKATKRAKRYIDKV